MRRPQERCTQRSEACTDIVNTRDLALVAQLLQLENRSFRAYYAAHRFDDSSFRYYLKNDRTINVVAKRDGQVIGYALGIVLCRSRKHFARLYSVAVHPRWRRQHVGTRLVEQFLASAMAMSCRVVTADIADRNHPAVTLFERVGFKRYRRLPDCYATGVDGMRVRLEFSSL